MLRILFSFSLSRSWLAGLAAILSVSQTLAATYVLPPPDIDLVGNLQYTAAKHNNDTLSDIARRFNIGFDQITQANPKVNAWYPKQGTRVLLPSRYILPKAERRGVVLNLPEMRLYYFKTVEGVPQVETHPISIGRMDWQTPLGLTTITEKLRNPAWHPPESIKREHAKEGDILPDVVEAGPDNPLGEYALRLGVKGYLIHGTDKEYGIGMRVTHGCIRMYPEDIEQIFRQVAAKTPVQFVNQPIKLGWQADILFIEVHPSLEEDNLTPQALLTKAEEMVAQATQQRRIRLDRRRLQMAVQTPSGLPIPIGKP
ncbi:MAG: L,D-transpeptidase family protein [Pseudomonadota bacterium]